MAQDKRDLRLEARWRDLVARQPQSGLSVRGFCQRERVTESAYYGWRRELRRRTQKEGPKEQTAVRPGFVPVVLPPAASAGAEEYIIIELRGGRVLRLPLVLPTARITELVNAVEGAS
jgi:transposase-like protein